MNLDLLHDGISCLLWLLLWLGVGLFFEKNRKMKGREKQLFWLAFLLKMLGALAFGAYFVYVQQGGDPVAYYECIQLVWEQTASHPDRYAAFLLSSPGDAVLPYHIYFTQGSPLAMIKVGSVLSLLSLNSFWGMNICLAGLQFFVSWFVFKRWYPAFDRKAWWGAFCLFFLPSVLFWGSGWGKDGLLWLALCLVLGAMLSLLTGKHRAAVLPLSMLGVGSFLIGFLKTPLIGMLIFALIAGVGISYIFSLGRWTRLGMLATASVIILVILFWQQSFFVELLSYQQWHKEAFFTGDSVYQIPEIHRIRELLIYLPYLLISGLFRPFPWEWGQVLVTIGGIEVMIILLLLAAWLWQQRGHRVIQSMLKDPVRMSLLVFACCLAVASILFSQNYGTLLRYRMPALAFWLFSFWPRQSS